MKKKFKEIELKKILNKIQFKEKICIIHSDFLSFFRFNLSIENFFKLLVESIGKEKIYIFPTFNWNLKKKWSSKNTKSSSGYLSEYVRTKKKVFRTLNPIHSICIYNDKKKVIPTNFTANAFEKKSTWNWLCESNDVVNLSLGIGLEGGATFLHLAEEKNKVFYRKLKKIKINIYDIKNKLVAKNFNYFARINNFKNSWKRCEKDLKRNKLIFYIKNKYKIPILLMKTSKVVNFISKKIKANNFYLLDN